MSMLEVRDLNVYYGGIHALKGISLDVEEGQIVSIIGSNGAGKSSMMNTISGIVKRQSGEILFRGEKLPSQANKIVKQGICQVPEGRLIFANLTTYENLILRLRDLSPSGRTEESDRRHAFRRRAADAGHGPRHHVGARADHAG